MNNVLLLKKDFIDKLKKERDELVMNNTSYNTTEKEFNDVQSKLLFIEGRLMGLREYHDVVVASIKEYWFYLWEEEWLNNTYKNNPELIIMNLRKRFVSLFCEVEE